MLNIAMVKAAGIYCISGAKTAIFRDFTYKNAIPKVPHHISLRPFAAIHRHRQNFLSRDQHLSQDASRVKPFAKRFLYDDNLGYGLEQSGTPVISYGNPKQANTIQSLKRPHHIRFGLCRAAERNADDAGLADPLRGLPDAAIGAERGTLAPVNAGFTMHAPMRLKSRYKVKLESWRSSKYTLGMVT